MQIPVQIVIISERTESIIGDYYLAPVFSFFNAVILPPHHLLIEGDGLQLPVHIVLVTIFGRVSKRPDLDFTLRHSAHVVVLNGDPVHQRPENLILDLLNAAVLVEVLRVGHHCCGDDLGTTEDRLLQQ